MQTGDLIFVKGKGPIDRGIEYFDHGPFSHVAMMMPYNTITESQYLVNTRDIANPYKPEEIVVVDLGLTDDERETLIHEHFKYLQRKYDLKQIAGIFLHDVLGLNTNKTWINKNELICSRYMAVLLNEIDYFKKRAYFEDVSMFTPNSMFPVVNKLRKLQPIMS